VYLGHVISRMTYDRYTKAIVGAAALTLVVSALAASGAASFAAQQDTTTQSQDTSYLRIGHFSPDAPPVDVLVDNETVVEGAEFGNVTDYLELESGNHTATITVANQSESVLFEGNLTLEPRTVGTLAASGEFTTDSETEFEPVLFEDNAWEPDNETAAVSIAHLSPDAPAVDVVVVESPSEGTATATGTETATATGTENATGTETATATGTENATGTETATETATGTETVTGTETETPLGSPTATPTATAVGATETATEAFGTATETDTVGVDNLMPAQQDGETYLAENLSFRNASDYMNVPAGNYTVEIRDNETGQVLATVDLSVDGGNAYTVYAAGYANPDDAPAGASFTTIPVEDATLTVTLPEMVTGTENATMNETATETATITGTENATMNETATETATDTGMGTETATDTGTETATDTGMGTETATGTGTETATDTGMGTETATETTEAGA